MRALCIHAKNGHIFLLENGTMLPVELDTKDKSTEEFARAMFATHPKFEEGELIMDGDAPNFIADRLNLVDSKKLYPKLDWEKLEKEDYL